jgi:hypothetical protein
MNRVKSTHKMIVAMTRRRKPVDQRRMATLTRNEREQLLLLALRKQKESNQ